MRRRLVGLVMLASGCGESVDRTQCEADLLALETTVAHIPMGLSLEPKRVSPPTGAVGAPAAGFAPLVEVDTSGTVTLDGRTMAGPAQLAQDLDTLRRNWSILHPRDPHRARIHVWADASLTLGRLHTALEGSYDHEAVLLILDEQHATPSVPCPPSLGALCTPAGDRTARRIAIWRQAVGRCASLLDLNRRVAASTPSERVPLLTGELVAATRACDCDADLAALNYATAEVLGGAPVYELALPSVDAMDPEMTVQAWVATAH